jgi:hypothetical protein
MTESNEFGDWWSDAMKERAVADYLLAIGPLAFLVAVIIGVVFYIVDGGSQ